MFLHGPNRAIALRRAATLPLLALAACVAGLAWAEPVGGGAPGGAPMVAGATAPSVDEILARNAAARGSIAAWKALRTLSEKGHIEHGQMKGPKTRHGNAAAGARAAGSSDQNVPFTLSIQRPHKMRLELNLGDLAALQLFDGTRGWFVQPSPRGPVVREFTPGESRALASQLDPEGPLLDAAAKGTTVALEGEDLLEGGPAYRLALTLQGGEVRHLWVDAKSWLDVKIDGTRLVDGKAWPMETWFYDWKTYGGLRIPCRIETAVNDVRSSTRILVDRVLLNEPIDEAQFRLPPATVAPPPVPPLAAPAGTR
jgi:hypothetical protein